jgi:PAS domain S-box-containing protein
MLRTKERKKNIEKLIKEWTSNGLLAAIGDGVSIQDTDFKVLYQNDVHKSFVGAHAGEHCYEAYEQQDHVCQGCPVLRAFNDGKVHTAERSVSTNRGVLYFDITASPLRDPDGEIIGGIEIVRDITARKKTEEALLKNRSELEEAVKARTSELLKINESLQEKISELRESKAKYDYLYNNLSDAAFIIGLDGRFIDVNDVAVRRLGYTREELLQMTLQEINSSDYVASIRERMNQVQQTGHHFFETVHVTRDGRLIPTEINTRLIQFEGRLAIMALARDITERKKAAEKELQEKERKYRALFANMLDGFAYHKMILDHNNRPIDYIFLEVNNAFERLTGLKRKDIIGKRVTEIIPGIKNSKPDLITIYGKVALSGEDITFEFFFEPFKKWYSISTYCPEIGYFATVFEDITERKNMEKSLIEIEERERRSIGHDLHDGLGQLLTGIAFKSHTLGRKLEKISLKEARDAAEISILIDKAKEQVSHIAKGLSPVEVDETGLMAALEELASNTKRMFNIQCSFNCAKPVFLHNKTVITQLYRIAQEAVTNAVKHARAKQIEISLVEEDGRISMTIKDDGIGIPRISKNTSGMGLKIMNYRASIINALLDIRKDIKGGTLVTCTFINSVGKND